MCGASCIDMPWLTDKSPDGCIIYNCPGADIDIVKEGYFDGEVRIRT